MTVVASNYARVANDLYQTEPWATEVLDFFFPVQYRHIWCASAGNHLMSDVLKDCGAQVITSDVATYDRAHDFMFDFLAGDDLFTPVDHDIVENPPYGAQNRVAAAYARKALKRSPGFVALLLTAKFDSGSTRYDLLSNNPRFTAKIVLTDRIKWFPGTDQTGTEDHAWFVWTERRPTAQPVLLYGGRGHAQ